MSDRTKKMVEDNLGLVGMCVKKLDVPIEESNDMFSVGVIGLIKAAQKFDVNKNTKFATFACCCINNEIFMEFRRRKKYSKEISLETPIGEQDCDEIVLGDLIGDEKADVEELIQNEEALEKILDIIINHLSSKEKYVVLSAAAGVMQNTLKEELNVSQSYISRIRSRSGKKIKAKMNLLSNVKNTGKYNIRVRNEKIYITFYATQEKVETKICDIDFPGYIPIFEVNYNNGKACIIVPAELDSMDFIAKVIHKLEELS